VGSYWLVTRNLGIPRVDGFREGIDLSSGLAPAERLKHSGMCRVLVAGAAVDPLDAHRLDGDVHHSQLRSSAPSFAFVLGSFVLFLPRLPRGMGISSIPVFRRSPQTEEILRRRHPPGIQFTTTGPVMQFVRRHHSLTSRWQDGKTQNSVLGFLRCGNRC
jgi:hypothetical protein